MDPSFMAGDGWKLTGGAAAPSNATGGFAGGGTFAPSSMFDSSGWTVSTGSSKATGGAINWQWVALAAVVGFIAYKRLAK